MKRLTIILVLATAGAQIQAQRINAHAREGNNQYKQGKFDKALSEYLLSIEAGANDPVTRYNLGNVYFRNAKFEEAATSFDKAAAENNETAFKQKAYYNQGVSFSKNNKLEESIVAYKKAVLMDPGDQDARVNLQKALLELKKRQPPEQQKKENEKKKQKNNKDQQNQPPKSNLTKKQVEQLLRALQQREQQVQQKMQQNRNRSAGKQEKEW